MKTEFTPGPWKLVHLGFGFYKVKASDDLPNGAICVIHETGKTTAEVKANAHLIAAAPGLYAFIRACLDCGSAEELHDFVVNNAEKVLEEVSK